MGSPSDSQASGLVDSVDGGLYWAVPFWWLEQVCSGGGEEDCGEFNVSLGEFEWLVG